MWVFNTAAQVGQRLCRHFCDAMSVSSLPSKAVKGVATLEDAARLKALPAVSRYICAWVTRISDLALVGGRAQLLSLHGGLDDRSAPLPALRFAIERPAAVGRGCAKTREAPWRAHGCTRSIDGRSNKCGHKRKFASLAIKATRRLFLCSYRFDQRRRTQNTDCSLHVVRQDVKAHLGSHPRKRFRQEVRRAHPELERPERVLDRLSS